MISEEFLMYYMWSFIVICLGASVWMMVSRRMRDRRRERMAFVAALRQKHDIPNKRPYNWAKEKNI
jgi:uncharacterized membrane protein YhaH (DUF805 family)